MRGRAEALSLATVDMLIAEEVPNGCCDHGLQAEESLADSRQAAEQFALKANGDPEGERHFLLASVYELRLKREAKRLSSRLKNLLYVHRHVNLADRRMSEKNEAFSSLYNACRREMLGLQDAQCLRILEWQQGQLMVKFREGNRQAYSLL